MISLNLVIIFLECSICKRNYQSTPEFFSDVDNRICKCCGCVWNCGSDEEKAQSKTLYFNKDFITLDDPDYLRNERIKKETERRKTETNFTEEPLFETLQEMEDYKRLLDVIERKKDSGPLFPELNKGWHPKERRRKKRS